MVKPLYRAMFFQFESAAYIRLKGIVSTKSLLIKSLTYSCESSINSSLEFIVSFLSCSFISLYASPPILSPSMLSVTSRFTFVSCLAINFAVNSLSAKSILHVSSSMSML